MGRVVALQSLLDARQVWHGNSTHIVDSHEPTGWAALDAALPSGGWPEHALTEILLPADGVGELQLVLPTLARLTRAGRAIVVITPPYVPYVPGWEARGIVMSQVDIIRAHENDVLWATEQCLRSGSCAAVLAWPRHADDRALRRLQVAADTGRALAFVFRDRAHAVQASPAALRLELESKPHWQIRVRKCRGGNPPENTIPLAAGWS